MAPHCVENKPLNGLQRLSRNSKEPVRRSTSERFPRRSFDCLALWRDGAASKDQEERNRELEVRLELACGQPASSKSNHR